MVHHGLWTAMLAIIGSCCALQAATFYVAPGGDDAGPGTRQRPFATLVGARDAVRAPRAQGDLLAGGVTVIVRGGTYEQPESFELTEEDSGTADAPVVFLAASGEEVRLSGGRAVPPEALVPVTDAEILARLDASAGDQVRQAGLADLGIPAPPPFPAKFRGSPSMPELFFNDDRMALARWPNEGWTSIARIIESGSRPRDGDNANLPGVFEYSGDRPGRWNVDAGVWLQGYWCYDWYDETIRVADIDSETRRITFTDAHLYGVKQGNPSPRRYRAVNLLEELDSPGEYYIDPVTETLYFWPPGEPADARMVLSMLQTPVVTLTGASHISLRGFIVEACQGDGIVVTGGSSNRIEACEVRNTRQLGIRVEGGANHTVVACDIHDTGTGGLHLSGGDRKALTPAGHEALNNHIWGFSRHQQTSAYGIVLGGVGNRAAHNLVHEAPHQAIAISGNDHTFEYNIVHGVCTETDDCGALYKGRNPSCRGNMIRHNFWHNIGSPMGHGNAAVYFDDGDGGDTVFGNVFFRCGEPGRGSFGTVFSHGGHGILAENNIFVECKRALGSAPWNDQRWKAAIDGGMGCFFQQKLLEEVDITKPPYITRYPELVGFMDPQPGDPRVSEAVRNVIVMGAEVKSGNWQVDPDENWVTDTDPGFIDAAGGNFGLRADSEVFTQLPGFQPIPFEEIGLYKDELRPAPPVEAWTYDPPKALSPMPQAPARPPAPPKGEPPVLEVPRASGPVRIDGDIAPAEWGLADPDAGMVLAQDVTGNKAEPQSRAWLAFDVQNLYIAIDSNVHPDTKLDGHQWGRDDAVEVSLRAREGAPIVVIRGYPDGSCDVGTTPDGSREPVKLDAQDVLYQARTPEPGRWTAELCIPFDRLGLRPSAGEQLAFNITVRKAVGDLWLMWEGTRGHSYDVDEAGRIRFAQ